MTHITCRLTAKNRDQLRNPTLGNRVRATFTVLTLSIQCNVDDYDYVVRISSMHLTNLHVFDDVFTARRYASAVFAVVMCPSVPPLSVRRKPVFYRNDWTNRGGFWHGGFLPPIPHCSIRKCGYLQKLEYFPLDLCPKLRTFGKISPRQVDRVVNNTPRRRRRSSLSTTPIRQSTSRGCLLQVGQL